VLPDPDHFPSGRVESNVGIAVSEAIGLDLLPPVGDVRLRRRSVLGAPVPVAAVDEDDDARRAEHEVRASPAIAEYRTVDAEAQAPRMELATEEQLRLRVAPASPGHPLAHGIGRRNDQRAIRPAEGQAAVSC
jgi:hypothetical protein